MKRRLILQQHNNLKYIKAMKKFIQNLFGKKTASFANFSITLLFSTRNADGKVVESEVFAQWLYYVIDRIPATLDCISDTVTNLAMSKHYQAIEEEILIVKIQSSDYSVTSDEMEQIIASFLKFGKHTFQSYVNYSVNGINYTLPVS